MAWGMHGRGGMCGGGTCEAGGYAWQGGVCGRGVCLTCMPPGQILQLQHTVNERVVRILLECILF